jgi:hypothetical protein
MAEGNGDGNGRPDGSIAVDGRFWTVADLTFRERRELREMVRQLMGNPHAEISDVSDDADIVPPLVATIKKRTDPSFTLDQALDMTEAELEEAARAVPTKAAKAAKTG